MIIRQLHLIHSYRMFYPNKVYIYYLPRFRERLLREKGHWYNDDCPIYGAFCKYFWESHVDLPHIPLDEVKAIVGS